MSCEHSVSDITRMDRDTSSPSHHVKEENSSTVITTGCSADSGVFQSYGVTPESSVIKSEAVADSEDDSNLEVPPQTVYIDVVGLGSEDEETPADVSDKQLQCSEDSGVSLNRASSPEVNSFASPPREQCLSKPVYASTPLWRPWSGAENPQTNDSSYHQATNPHYPVDYRGQYINPGNYLSSPETLWRLSQQYSNNAHYNKFFGAVSPVGYHIPHPSVFHQAYPIMGSPVVGHGTSYLQSPYQCQVPQVTTTTGAIKSELKRPASEFITGAPEKYLRRTSTPESPDMQPLADGHSKGYESAQHVAGVQLGVPPVDALPVRVTLKGKRKAVKEDQSDKNLNRVSDSSKKRDRPPPYGDHELHEFVVQFEDIPLKLNYCDSTGKYRVPNVPDSPEKKEQLRGDLLDLFLHSNLPKVPVALQDNVHALVHFPNMQHLLSLYVEGVNLDTLQYGAYGQAFANPRLTSLSEDELNAILDKMSYVGADGLMHCLVRRAINNGAVCDHVAKELGKMRRHSKNHFPQKKWVCCFCRAQMPDMTDMERHTSTHTVLKPFRCTECCKVFSQKVTLTHHMRNVHNQELETLNPKKTLVCRQHGCLFLEHQREECLLHLEQHHAKSEDFKNRKKRNQWPYDM